MEDCVGGLGGVAFGSGKYRQLNQGQKKGR
jgi:hypothetical protein